MLSRLPKDRVWIFKNKDSHRSLAIPSPNRQNIIANGNAHAYKRNCKHQQTGFDHQDLIMPMDSLIDDPLDQTGMARSNDTRVASRNKARIDLALCG